MSSDTRHFEELMVSLRRLRLILAEEQNAQGYLSLFDDFLQETELGLALHCVCDYLLETETPVPAASITEEIHALHVAMGIEDDCTNRLREKSASSTGTGGKKGE